MHAALALVGGNGMPREQLGLDEKKVRLWAHDVTKLSYDLEDVADTVLVLFRGGSTEHNAMEVLMRLMREMSEQMLYGTMHHPLISDAMDKQPECAATSRGTARYTNTAVDHSYPEMGHGPNYSYESRSRPAHRTVLGHREKTMPKIHGSTWAFVPRPRATMPQVEWDLDQNLSLATSTKLVGIDGPRDEVIEMLSMGDQSKLKIVSVFGFGGLGKTTLAKTVYNKAKPGFQCTAFVTVGRNPDMNRVLRIFFIILTRKSLPTHTH